MIGIAGDACNAAIAVGWLIGAASGLLAAVALLLALARAGHSVGGRHVLWVLAPVWIGGGWYVGLDAVACYANAIAVATLLLIALPLLLLIGTAAHQIGRRSIR